MPALLIAFILGCFGFFMDFQGLKAKVSNIEFQFKYISERLDEIKADVKELKGGM